MKWLLGLIVWVLLGIVGLFTGENGSDGNAGDGGNSSGGENGGADGEVKIEDLPEPIQKYIKSLRDEAKKHRLERNAQAEAAEKERRDRETAERQRLADEQKYKELWEKVSSRLPELEEKAKLADQFLDATKASNAARIERIPENRRSMIPTDYSPEKLRAWLDVNEATLLQSRQAPDLNQGQQGAGGSSGSSAIKLTAEQKEFAKAAGMTEEEYAKYLGIHLARVGGKEAS